MGFWLFMFIMSLLIPAAMIGFGFLSLKGWPEEINSICGYRTTMSMKNQDTWSFAQHYYGKLWFVAGCILLPVTVIVMILLYGKDEDTIGIYGSVVCLIQCIPMVGTIYPVEKALKKNFDKDGNWI